MKQAIFLVVANGFEVGGRDHIIYASTIESERDTVLANSKNQSRYSKTEIVADLDDVARQAWLRLNGLERLALERTDCPIWSEKAQSKASI